MEKGVLENRISHKTLNLCITNSVISVKCMNTDKKAKKLQINRLLLQSDI